MKQLLILSLIIFSSLVFGQDKTYRFLYDFHQKTTLTNDERMYNEADFIVLYEKELNKSYEVEVVTNSEFSLIKTVEKLDNSQTGQFLYFGPVPKWYLVDFKNNKSFKESHGQYVSDTISHIKITPTRNTKTVLGIEAKEFTAENENYIYSFWLAKQNGITVSPVYFQFNGYIVLELHIKSKLYEKEGGSNNIQYKLKEIDEQVFNLKKEIPKRYLSIQESKDLYDKTMKMNNVGVEKD